MSKYSSIPGASRFSKSTLDSVYKRGLAAYFSAGSRPKVSQHQWAMARVNSAQPSKDWAVVKKSKAKKK